MTSYVERLGTLAAQMDAKALPPRIVERLRSFLLYNLAMGMVGYQTSDTTWRAIKAVPVAAGRSSVIGTGETVSVVDAAFMNAALVTARGQNDTLKDVNGHIGCVVIPAVLALAQDRGAAMPEILAGLAAGYEVQGHVGNGAAAQAAKRGFRATSVFGVLGAAAAAARVIGLDPQKVAHALAIACNFSSGVMQCWAEGSMEWRLQVAQASRGGVLAALLAEQGVTGARYALEGGAGLYRALGTDVPPLDFTVWRMERVTFKPYPGCAINQGPVFALLSLINSDAVQASDVLSVDVHLTPEQAAYPGVANYGPFSSASGAVMSTAFMMTVALRDRALFQRHFLAEYADPQLAERSRNVRVVADASLKPGSSKVVLHVTGGGQISKGCVDEDNFIFGWDDTVRLAKAVGNELPGAGASERITRLSEALQPSGTTNADTLMAFCVT